MRKSYLREAVEELKNFYIQELQEAGLLIVSDEDISSLTLSELENMYKFYNLHN
ncbi:Fur-regulated basic protein A [Thalassobacillus cyri]|uniref:Fur-regulated basic protein A n=1 Tax=Thalassobacillus cyri TaxID=571932 RepID=A0A1H4F4J3_9BACI|nr:Fur-regulated basic protein FbpA [Thalassobacillus cyri]SEA91847.1 Fur-regulated basic protein A [Thalassobacillus cyri]